jgi:hypothetical protein
MTTRKEAHSMALAASVGALSEKHMSLLACVQSHEKAMTPQVLKASFKSRGIYPFSLALALERQFLQQLQPPEVKWFRPISMFCLLQLLALFALSI